MHANPLRPLLTWPYDTRSDSIDILNYEINLDITDLTNKVITGYTGIRFSPVVNGIASIRLDLKSLTVDSVVWENGSQLTFTRTADHLIFTFPSVQNNADTSSFRVYYHGTPHTDAVFGGFYFQGSFAYNVGVSLDDIPHNYGRTWFPCFDNFIDRATYDLVITTQDIHKAVGGGVLISETDNGNGTKTFTWRVNQTIPTYLVSVAVNNFAYVQTNYSSISGPPVPVWLAARPSDTADLSASFTNLEPAFHIFEDKFGPYHWDRVGYSIVPMTAGAMEHAMNIAYPILLADGSQTYQDVMAHELSHHWWGNLVTCRTAEDMWINEGSAVYCEYVFNEEHYGPDQYRTLVRSTHKSLLHKAHIDDGGYWPLSGIPQTHTYGVTTYQKGADIIHTLRAYLGDSLFFGGLTELLQQNAFSDIDAEEYRDDLSAITGVPLTDFFDDWIFQEGWPHFSVDSMQSSPSGPDFNVNVWFRQKLTGRTNYSHNVPFTLTFIDADWNTYTEHTVIDGVTDMATFVLPEAPLLVILNEDEKISHAVTAESQVIRSAGNYNLTHANFTLNATGITDSVYFRVEHNWTGADPVTDWTKGFTVSPQRYWRVDWLGSLTAEATLSYNGRPTSTGYLDNLLLTGAEDSLVLLYRPDPGYDWVEYPDYTKVMGANVTDKIGSVNLHSLQKGEYTFAYKTGVTGMEEQEGSYLKVFPNPSRDQWNVQLTGAAVQHPAFKLYGSKGEILYNLNQVTGSNFIIPAAAFPAGIYFLCLYDGGRLISSKKVVKE